MGCTTAKHEALKLDETRWKRETIPPHGHKTRPVTADDEEWLEWANCRRCQTTLARPVDMKFRFKRS